MKKFLSLVLAFGLAPGLWARPLPSAGARALALGGAYTAESEDVNALFYNPAGLTGLTGSQLSLNYGRLDIGRPTDITEVHAAYGTPTQAMGRPIGAAGGFLAQSVAPGAHVFDIYAGAGSDVPTKGLVPWPVRGGGVFKIRQQKGDDKDALIGKSQLGLGLDAGGLVEFSPKLSAGAVLRDLFLGSVNPAGPQLRLGAHYRYDPQVLLLSDLEIRRNVTSLHAGLEFYFYRELLRLRIGNAFTQQGVDHVALGAGFNFSPAQIDVAYVIPLKTLNDASEQFRISLVYRFNAPKFSELYFDRALDMAEELDRRVADLLDKEEKLKTAVKDLEQARRLAEEELSRTAVRRSESQKEADDRLLRAQARVSEAEKRAAALEEQVRGAEETIRRAKQIAAQRRPAAPKEPSAPKIRTHLVQPGDSLRSLAEKYYKDPERWKKIFDANQDKMDRGRPVPGATLVIPE